MSTTAVKPPPPLALFAMTSRRRRRSSTAASSILFAPVRSVSSPARGSLSSLCCLFLAFALSVSAAAAAYSVEDGRCLGFRDVCADGSSFCFSFSAVQTLLASDDKGVKEPDLGVSRDWGPSRPMYFPMSGGGTVTCSSVDARITGAPGVMGQGGKDVARYDAGSCQAPLVPDNWMQASQGMPPELDGTSTTTDGNNPNGLYSSSSMNVEINPPVLDWSRSNLYAASMASLTVVNLNNDSVLRVYEPFSTDPQFYVYGYEDLVLQPGENASVTFIFLPKLLGSSSAHLVLQTNFGGFIIQAKGVAVRSPYQILPLTRMDVVLGGHLEKNLSIYNPYDDSLYVEEVAVWMSSFESTKQSSHVVCQSGPSNEAVELTSLSSNWHTASSTEFGRPMFHIRPSEQWEVLPSKSSTVVELKLQPNSEGKVFGAIYMKLRNYTTDTMDIVVIPIELEVHTRTFYDSTNLVSVTFERISSCATNGSIYSLSLRNDATELLRVVSVAVDNRDHLMFFQVKYLNGLILFPDTVTDIALIRYTASVPEDISFDNCNIVVETNSSLGSSIVIPCQDIMRASIHYTASVVVAESDEPAVGSFSEEISANSRSGSLDSIIETEGLDNMKLPIRRAVRADDMVLRNWRSHGTMTGNSVLTNHELVFPVVQIGSQFSKWITVHNPSQQHVSMQLVLNSEEIIGQCKTVNDACEHTFSSRSPEIDSTETRYGFSLGVAAITEAYLGPSASALLGPIVFRPSNRCIWSSMVLIRNNLSGLEWLPLRANGGWQSIALLEGPEPVWKLEFNLGSDLHDNSTVSKSEITSPLCSQQLSKEIHVKNSGDLPLRVTKVKVSGVDCGLDGFTANNSKGFSLAPSESIKLLISFKADFSSVKVQRDLELAMTTGIFVIPMTANVPLYMLKQCRKSYFRSIHWKTLILFLGTVSLFIVVFVRYAPYSLSVSSKDYYVKIDEGKDTNTITKTVKPSLLQGSNKTTRSMREHRKNEALPEKCPPSTLDRPQKKDDKSSPDKQPNTATAISVSPANPVEDKVSIEATQTSGNLTIRVARDKGRRRKRKVGGAGLAAKIEVSSSHSGNSTPSSPLSPSLTPKQGWSFSGAPSELKHKSKPESRLDAEARSPSTGYNKEKNGWSRTAKLQPPAPSATSVNPLTSSTGLNTAWTSPLLAASSPIAPHARAPGSNLMKDRAVKRDEGVTALKKEFTYDIWGNNFSGHLLGKAKEVMPYKLFDASEGASHSFFVREPQALMMKQPSAPVMPYKLFDASEGASHSFFVREPQALMMKQPSAPPDSHGHGRGSQPSSDVASGYGIN